jgi:hypothetical protein
MVKKLTKFALNIVIFSLIVLPTVSSAQEDDDREFGWVESIRLFDNFDLGEYILEQFFPQLAPQEKGMGDESQISDTVSQIKNTWNINFISEPDEETLEIIEFYDVEYEPLAVNILETGVEELRSTLEVYPEELFEDLGEIDFFMVESLTSEGEEYTGFYLPPNLILVTYDEYEPSNWFEDTVHHELFHYLEQEISFIEYVRANEEWEELSDACEISYDEEGWYDNADLYDYVPPECYASWYGTSMPSEDRAEVAGQLMVTFSHQNLIDRTAEDAILMQKVELIKEFYADASGGRMAGEYWNIIKEGGVYEGNGSKSDISTEKLLGLVLCPVCGSQ